MNTDDVEEEYQRRLDDIVINETCCLVYTSGTVGAPKGVMLNHDNLTWGAYSVGLSFGSMEYGKEIVVSYLPLSHVAAQTVDIFSGLIFAFNVYFADRDALKGSLVKTLTSVKPTLFVGVPRVYEKMQDRMMSVGASSGSFKKFVSKWAKGVALKHYMNEDSTSLNLEYKLAKSLIFSKVRKALGFDRCKIFVCSAAPTSAETKRFFMSLDMPLSEAFGMSEASGAHIATFVTGTRATDTIGTPVFGTEIKILDPNEKGHGEVSFFYLFGALEALRP
jgi:long-chain-fatty-acid--CoA ligase ACSBG